MIPNTFGLSEMKRWDEVKDAFAEAAVVRDEGTETSEVSWCLIRVVMLMCRVSGKVRL